MKASDKKYMTLALKLAGKARDKTYPNPMVGAVIVKGGKIVGRGYHRRAGEDHAEIRAIKASGASCSGGTMFVTLEPCDHYGKTPPCTRAIIESGIKAVNVAMKDPNPLNSGRGIRKLRNAGISVNVGLCGAEARELNRKYIKFITRGVPYVTVKLAQSLDGKIAARDGTSKWISSGVSREFTRKIRSGFDAVVVGVNTVVEDDPYLLDEKRRGQGAARVIVDTRLRTPFDSNIIRTADRSPVIIGTTELAPGTRVAKFRALKGVEVVVTTSGASRVSLKRFFRTLAARGMVNILVEGGGELVGSLMDGSMVDEFMFFIAPKVIGGNHSSIKGRGAINISRVPELHDLKIKRSGKDIMVRGLVRV